MRLEIRTRDGTHEVDCAEDERILYAALRGGVALPYECATGTCGTCKARAKPGTVETTWPDAPGAQTLNAERGEFLMCQSRLRAAAQILVPGTVPTGRVDANARPAHLRGRIENPIAMTGDVLEFEVALDRRIDFEAGQFAVLGHPGIEGGRAYSMSDFARGTDRLEFVAKRKPGGRFTEWLFGPGIEGAGVSVFGPLGAATFDPDEDLDTICIAGGSGIAGMLAILARARDSGYLARRRLALYFGVRTRADIGFETRLLEHLASAPPGALSVTVALSHESPPGDGGPSGLRLIEGFVHEAVARDLAGPLADTVGFVAGPPPMVDAAIRTLLVDGGLEADRIRYDKFS